MNARLPAHLLVSALVRRANQEGGFATVLARGDRDSGVILLVCSERGAVPTLLERGIGADGRVQLLRSGPQDLADTTAADDYWRRRRAGDPDMWVVELDIADSERFAAETLLPV